MRGPPAAPGPCRTDEADLPVPDDEADRYTWNEVNRLSELKNPQGRVTTYRYNNKDVRTTTTYPGGTVQKADVDNTSRPKPIEATSPQGTLADLAYTLNGAPSSRAASSVTHVTHRLPS
ncbi:RHS repeat domain-containing protein [Streptomyces sp. NPDC047706]|uniref:RHS repeat domain-containing protein n=1 Tax=Streptomyces sp. NPDC047706 TaxID=3365486 RepID=UPI003717E622